MSNALLVVFRTLRQLWLRVAAFCVLGLVAALAAVVFAPWVPADFALTIGTGAVDQVLSILASSMLAVATFSLAAFVTTYTAIAAVATPRAAKLMVSDGRSQGAIATFVGAFVYGVVGVFALQTGYYGAQGRVILFFVTIAVLVLVVVALVQWVGQLSRLGQADEAIVRVAGATRTALKARLRWSGGAESDEASGAVAVAATEVGYVRNIDVEGLETLARELGVVVFADSLPGAEVGGARPLFRFKGRARLSADDLARLRSRFLIGDRRSFDQDPVYGFIVLGQIAAKALSPGVNDAGTAIDVVSTGVGLLAEWIKTADEHAATNLANLRFPSLSADDLLDSLAALYGAGDASVGVRLQSAMLTLVALGDPAMTRAAHRHARLALDRAMQTLELDDDKQRVRRAAEPADSAA